MVAHFDPFFVDHPSALAIAIVIVVPSSLSPSESV